MARARFHVAKLSPSGIGGMLPSPGYFCLPAFPMQSQGQAVLPRDYRIARAAAKSRQHLTPTSTQ
eukprot:5050371-Pleurochrysis_carterae.AAC.1